MIRCLCVYHYVSDVPQYGRSRVPTVTLIAEHIMTPLQAVWKPKGELVFSRSVRDRRGHNVDNVEDLQALRASLAVLQC